MQLELFVLETQAKPLEKHVAYQVQQIEDARRALSRANARIGALKNYNTPIYSLPNELWLYIVKLAQQSSSTSLFDEETLPLEIAMSHISSRWRDVVISAPTLWTHIGSASMQWTTKLLGMYLRRSQPCPVTVILRPGRSVESDKNKLVQLVHHVDRFEDLTLTYGAGAESYYSQVLKSLQAPKLKALRLHWTGHPQKISLFTGGAPLLSVLYLNDCILNESTILSAVTMFRQRISHAMNPLSWPVKLALSQMTQLTKLEVCVDDLREVGPFDIPSLRFLALDFDAYEGIQVPLDMFPISSPNLESLVMIDCHGDQTMSVLNRLGASRSQRLYPNLHSLVLWSRSRYGSCACDPDIPPPNIADAIQTFSTISHISFINVCHQGLILRILLHDAVELIQPTSRSTLPWANLQSVTVSPLHMVSCRELFKPRKDCGYPISKLRVTKDGLSDLSRLSLEERAEIPEVEIFDKGEFLDSLTWNQ